MYHKQTSSYDNSWGRSVREQLISLDEYGTNALILHPCHSQDPSSSPLSPKTSVKAPTVLLCGWYGATPHLLRRHVRLFHDWGYIVIVITTPTSVVFAPRVSVPVNFCANLLAALTRAENEDGREDGGFVGGGLVLVCMSTAGSMIAYGFAQLFQMIDEPSGKNETQSVRLDDSLKHTIIRTRTSLAAVVFDSAPAKMHDSMGGRALASGQGVNSNSVMGQTLRALYGIYSVARRWIFDDLPSHFWGYLGTAHYGGCPELYMYSQGDTLLDVDALTELIKKRKEIGRPVQTLQIERAPHVAILKLYADIYRNTLGSFLDDALAIRRARLGHSIWMHSRAVNANLLPVASAKL